MRFPGGCILALAAIIFALFPGPAPAADDLEDLSLEELMDVEVVTASRRTEALSRVPGAVTVLTEEDIFRSGATSIPEALKLVPGVHVSRIDTDKWAVGIRGFNGLLSNKHLVLLDGRPITSPTTSGVNWGSAVPVNMIKRIEVVRGAWTSLWGAESFTGVINIITKTAAEAQGGQSVTTVGTSGVEQMVRYGEKVGGNGHAVGFGRTAYEDGDGIKGDDKKRGSRDWKAFQGGFRYDWENAYTDLLTLQGEMQESRIHETSAGVDRFFAPRDTVSHNGYTQFVWDRATGLDAGIRFRTSFSHGGIQMGDFSDSSNTVDAELQYAAEQAGIHRLTWGAGSRYYWDDPPELDRREREHDDHSFTGNAFVQDRITILPESLYLFLGSKLDYLGQGGPEIQPSVRLLHTFEDSEYWLAVSRAVRTDNWYQQSGNFFIDYRGSRYRVVAPGDLDTEELIAYEAGYRHRFSRDASLDISLYVNDYDDLIMYDFNKATNTAVLTNSLKGTAYGLEALYEWRMSDRVTLRPSVSLIYQRLYGLDAIPMGGAMPEEGVGSEVKLQVMTKPAQDVGLDVLAGFIDSPDKRAYPGYFEVEAHASWRATDQLLLEVIGRNLAGADNRFSELRVDPSLKLRLTWDF